MTDNKTDIRRQNIKVIDLFEYVAMFIDMTNWLNFRAQTMLRPKPVQFLKNHWDFIPLFMSVGFGYWYASTRFYHRMADDPEKRTNNLEIPEYIVRVNDKSVFSDEFKSMAENLD